MTLPQNVYDYFFWKALGKLETIYRDNDYGLGWVFDCDEIDRLPVIDVLYGGVWLEIQVDDYVLNLDGDTCGMCITDSGDKNFATFGDSLLRNYYVIHDKENDRIGFAPLVGATNTKAKAEYGIEPECSYTQGDCSTDFADTETHPDTPLWALIVVIVICFLVLICVISILVCICYSSSTEEPEEVSEAQDTAIETPEEETEEETPAEKPEDPVAPPPPKPEEKEPFVEPPIDDADDAEQDTTTTDETATQPAEAPPNEAAPETEAPADPTPSELTTLLRRLLAESKKR